MNPRAFSTTMCDDCGRNTGFRGHRLCQSCETKVRTRKLRIAGTPLRHLSADEIVQAKRMHASFKSLAEIAKAFDTNVYAIRTALGKR